MDEPSPNPPQPEPSPLDDEPPDKVQEASEESYPASDPPAWIPTKVA